MDLVGRRQLTNKHVHEGDRLPERAEERRRRSDARRPLQGRRDAEHHRRLERRPGHLRRARPRRSTPRCSTARGRSRSSRPRSRTRRSPAPPSRPAPGGSVSVVGGEDIVMTKSSKNKAAAAEFMRFMLALVAQNQMARAGQMPVLKSSTKQLVKIHPVLRDLPEADRERQAADADAEVAADRPGPPDRDRQGVQGRSRPSSRRSTSAAKQIDGLLK